MTTISSLLNKDSPPPSPTHQPHHPVSSPTSSLSPRSLKETHTPPQIYSQPSSPSFEIHSAPLKHKRKSTSDSPNMTLSDSLRHRLRERNDVFDSDEDSIGDDGLSKSRKVDGLRSSPRSSPRPATTSAPTSTSHISSIQQLLSEDEPAISPTLLPRLAHMAIRHTSPSPLTHESKLTRLTYQSPLIARQAHPHSSTPNSSRSPAPLRTQSIPLCCSSLPDSVHNKASSLASQLEEPTADSISKSLDDSLARDVPTLRSQFEVVTAENDRLRDFNRSLLSKIERSYEQLFQSQHRPKQLCEQREMLKEQFSQKQMQVRQLREEWERMIVALAS